MIKKLGEMVNTARTILKLHINYIDGPPPPKPAVQANEFRPVLSETEQLALVEKACDRWDEIKGKFAQKGYSNLKTAEDFFPVTTTSITELDTQVNKYKKALAKNSKSAGGIV